MHIVSNMSPEGGGPQEVVRMLIQHAPPGYSSEVVTLDDPAAQFLSALPFQVHALGPKRNWSSPKLIPWLRANRQRFDGVMLHGLWEATGMATLRAIAGHRPYVVFSHGMLDPYFKRAFPAKHLKKWGYWLLAEYWVLRRAFRVLFTTQLEANLARQSFWLSQWNPMVVALGAEPPPPALEATTAFYDRCPEVTQHRFLLFLGRIDPKKGCDLLIEAFTAIASQDPDLHLVMAGPDPSNWRDRLQASAALGGIATRVHWPGMLTGDAKAGAFQACDAFVLPSHQENFGIAVVEALSYAKPVLLSDQINIAPDVLADGCALVEPDSLEGTRRLLQRWLNLPADTRAAMSRQALQTFTKRYDMRRNAETILRVFEQIAPAPANTLAEVS